jgi:hypothetical protein
VRAIGLTVVVVVAGYLFAVARFLLHSDMYDY